MTIKIFMLFATFSAVLFVTQTVSCEEVENDRPDVLYISNPGTFPKILTDASDPLTKGERRNLFCTNLECQRISWALNFRFGRCNTYNICVCSNF